MHPVEGLWQPVHAEHKGEPAPKMMLDQMEVELINGSYFVRFGGVAADHGTYEVEPDGLTLRGVTGPNAGKEIPCLFKFDGEHLVICYGLGGARPVKFGTAADTPHYLAKYARKR
jgi:uncharacterized protein (TIGR03067 family)